MTRKSEAPTLADLENQARIDLYARIIADPAAPPELAAEAARSLMTRSEVSRATVADMPREMRLALRALLEPAELVAEREDVAALRAAILALAR